MGGNSADNGYWLFQTRTSGLLVLYLSIQNDVFLCDLYATSSN